VNFKYVFDSEKSLFLICWVQFAP